MKTPSNSAEAWKFQDILLETYTFAPSLRMPLHSHDEYQLGLLVSAPGEYRYRGATYLAPARSLSVVHPGEIHSGHSHGDSPYVSTRVFYIPPTWFQTIAQEVSPSTPTDSFPYITSPILDDKALIRQFIHLHTMLGSSESYLEQETLLLDALTALITGFAEKPRDQRRYPSAHGSIQRVRDYLHQHYVENTSLQTLAHLAELSPNHLCFLFRQHFGLPPHLYQTQLRINHAKSLLLNGLTPGQVAVASGFAHQSHFTTHFRRFVGVTPGQYIHSRRASSKRH